MKFNQKDAKSRRELLISFPDYAKKEYKNSELIRAYNNLHLKGGSLYLADFTSSRKDGDSFYRAIIVNFLS